MGIAVLQIHFNLCQPHALVLIMYLKSVKILLVPPKWEMIMVPSNYSTTCISIDYVFKVSQNIIGAPKMWNNYGALQLCQLHALVLIMYLQSSKIFLMPRKCEIMMVHSNYYCNVSFLRYRYWIFFLYCSF